jgi:uncharacterized protein YbjT (DUF2867 family)
LFAYLCITDIMSNKVVIAGASGLTGGHLLNMLLNAPQYNEVLILVRKELPISHKKLVQLIVDFDQLDSYQGAITGKAVFCCLGTTRSKTPDSDTYRKIEYDYPVKLAQIASANNVQQFHFMSSVGADAGSGNQYLRNKGEAENAIQQLKFNTTHIYRPSLLTGDRKEFRFAEKAAAVFMKLVDPLLMGSFKKYVSIPAATVAKAMYKQSLKPEEGVYIHPSHHIKQIA